jgi:hypothetical protein
MNRYSNTLIVLLLVIGGWQNASLTASFSRPASEQPPLATREDSRPEHSVMSAYQLSVGNVAIGLPAAALNVQSPA